VPLGVEDDGIEVDPEDSDALRAEIRSHDLSDIPHKEEHLVEEDEEYNDDEPEHHIDGLPVGYEAYDVVDETNPDDIALFEVAERSHKGIEGERTTEQLTIQEMELRQQPGNAVRAKRDARDLADTTTGIRKRSCQLHRRPSRSTIGLLVKRARAPWRWREIFHLWSLRPRHPSRRDTMRVT
jgi:hypothetical protein